MGAKRIRGGILWNSMHDCHLKARALQAKHDEAPKDPPEMYWIAPADDEGVMRG